MRHKVQWVLSTLILSSIIIFSSTKSFGQAASLYGIITNEKTSDVLAGANVIITSGEFRKGTSTNSKGEYKIQDLPAGSYTLSITFISYKSKIIKDIVLAAYETKLLNIELIPAGIEMNPVVVTASRRPEKVTEAPAAVIVLESTNIESNPTLVTTEHLKGLTAVDVVSTGLNQDRVVIRGFNGAISSRLLVLIDNRLAQVPSLRFNVYNLIPSIDEDIDRIELVLGPGSALYGPNSAGGVMHIITKSPFSSKGTTVTIGGGERSIFMASFRHAGIFNQQIGYKISGQYYQGNDWEYFDETDHDSIERDFNVEKISADARFDFLLTNDFTAILSGGISRISDIEITGASAVQAIDWTSSYIQGRLSYKALFAQVYFNRSDAGESFFLRNGDLLIDNSSLLVAQIQHGFTLMNERQRFTYGTDLLLTRPNTQNTLHGRNEDNDDINEIGVYLQSETILSSKLNLILAARIDDNNRLQDMVFSPRAAIVYRANENNTFRITYNRAYQTPETGDFFFDFNVSPTLDGLPFGVQLRGVPETGYNFRRDENGGIGGLYMQSPFTPEPFDLPAEATQLWDVVVSLLAQEGIDISALPPPNSEQVGSILKLLDTNTGEFVAASPDDVIDIAPLEPQRTTAFEIGYIGNISEKLVIGTNIYYENNINFIAPYVVETPNVFFDPASLTSYFISFGISADTASALSSAIAEIPVGTVTPEEGDPADLLVTTRTYGNVSHYGVELSLTYYTLGYWAFRGNYSYVSENFWERKVGEPEDVALNAPKHKIGVAVHYNNPNLGFISQLRLRYIDSFPVVSGVGRGTVPSYFVMDINASYKLPFNRSFELALSIQNLLNNLHTEFVAVPEIGRLAILRIKYSF
ncbi:MAG: TonB-dependent receptor [Bacteroidetes bacterium]|nr:TonB-dependent receptor [Bacteroidota bacterium]